MLCEKDGSLAVNPAKGKFMSFMGALLSEDVKARVAKMKLKVHTNVEKIFGSHI